MRLTWGLFRLASMMIRKFAGLSPNTTLFQLHRLLPVPIGCSTPARRPDSRPLTTADVLMVRKAASKYAKRDDRTMMAISGFFCLCHPIQDFGFADRQPKCSQGLRSVITWSVLNAQERQVFGGRERKALDFNLSLFRITNYKRFFGIAHQSTKCEVRREELDLRTQ